MSLKTFKIQSGLDIDGVVLSASASELLVSGSVISTEAYVDAAVAAIPAVTVDSEGGLVDGANGLAINIGSGGNGIVLDTSGVIGIDTSTVATKTYVDGVAQGLDVKQSVKVATTESFTNFGTDFDKFNSDPEGIQFLVNSIQIDGEAINDGDRVLVKDEITPNVAFNGIWVWDAANTKFVRASDSDNPTDLNTGAFTFIEKGSANGGKGFVANVTLDAMDDFQSIGWTQFSEAGTFITSVDPTSFDVSNGELGLSASVAGDGLTLSNGELSVATGPGLQISNGQVVPDIGSGLEISALSNDLQLSIQGNFLQLDGMTGALTNTNSPFFNSVTVGTDGVLVQDGTGFESKSTLFSGSYLLGDSGLKTVGTIPLTEAGAEIATSGEFFITLSNPTGSRRVSKVAWLWNGNSEISYNEYSIIETGGSISGVDIQMSYSNQDGAELKVQAVAGTKIIANAIINKLA